MKKALSIILCLIMVMGLFTVIPFSANAAEKATVSIYNLYGEVDEVKEFNVGDEFTVYIALNCSNVSGGYIGSIKGEQGFTNSILEEIDEKNVTDTKTTFMYVNEVFPVTNERTTANAGLEDRISYNASTPEFDENGFHFNSDDSLLMVTKYRVIAPGEASITNSMRTLCVANFELTRFIDKGVIYNDNFTLRGSFTMPTVLPTSTFSNDDDVMLKVGESLKLSASSMLDNTNAVTWSSSNPSVASVSGSGVVTGKKQGYAFITAKTSSGLEARCFVYVNDGIEFTFGDIDEDGEVSVIDSTIIQRYLSDLPTLPFIEKAADVDRDDEISVIDATMIQRYLAMMPTNANIGRYVSGNVFFTGWSNWTTVVPSSGDNLITDTKTEYRYKDLMTKKATSQPATPSGYTFVSSQKTGTYTNWSDWSAWTTEWHGNSDLENVRTTTGYRYYRFVCPNCGHGDPYQGNCSVCGYYLSPSNWDEMYYPEYGPNIRSGNWDKAKGYVYINNVQWTFEEPGYSDGQGGTGQPTTTMYSYQTRSEYINYKYIQTNFSEWQTTPVTASDTRQVETRTVYRYRFIIE